MKRNAVLVLGLLVLAASVAGCSGSGGDDGDFTTPYPFGGSWTFRMTVVEDPVGWSADDRKAPLGTSYSSQYTILQSGKSVTLQDRTSRFGEQFFGTCDPDGGSLRAVYNYNNGYIVTVIELQAESDDALTGTWVSDEKPSPGFPNGKHIKNTIRATRN